MKSTLTKQQVEELSRHYEDAIVVLNAAAIEDGHIPAQDTDAYRLASALAGLLHGIDRFLLNHGRRWLDPEAVRIIEACILAKEGQPQ